MTKSRILSLIAGAACALPALAQTAEVGTLPFGGEIVLGADHIVASSSPIRGGFESRAIGNIYDNVTNVFGNNTGGTFLAQNNMIGEDISFVGSPWALPAAGRQITGMTFGAAIITTASNANENFFVVFWNPADVNYAGNAGTGTNMITPGAVPLGFSLVALGVQNASFIYQFTVNGLAINIPDGINGVFVQAGWLKASAGTPADWSNLNGLLDEDCPGASTRGLAFGSNTLAGPGGNPASVGSTLPDYARDILSDTVCTAPSGCTHSGIFLGAAAPATGGCVERRTILVTPTGGSPAQAGYQIRLQGDITATAPANTNLGAINDTQGPVTGTVASSATQWYQFTLNSDATDAALQFLDIDSEGSATDVAIGFYDNAGTLIESDDNSGSGTNAQLSFGVGRRAAVADGVQYDGRSGELLAGVYFVAVAPGGSTFGSGFTSNASANPGGAFTLHLGTNVNGTPLAPSVAPLINGIDYDAVIGAPVDPDFPGGDFRQGAPHTTGTRGVVWNRFTLQSAIDAAHFLDLDYVGGGSTLTADGVAYIFDSNGNIIYFSDDNSAGTLLPQFSIGASGSRFYGAVGPFDGNTPLGASAGLPAGVYYLAELLFDANDSDLSFLPTDHRWHVRSASGSNLTLSAILVAGQGGGGNVCDPDVNQDGNADQGDVDYLINVAAGGPNPTGIDPDFNHDGNVDQGDIDALLNVVAGGPCP